MSDPALDAVQRARNNDRDGWLTAPELALDAAREALAPIRAVLDQVAVNRDALPDSSNTRIALLYALALGRISSLVYARVKDDR